MSLYILTGRYRGSIFLTRTYFGWWTVWVVLVACIPGGYEVMTCIEDEMQRVYLYPALICLR